MAGRTKNKLRFTKAAIKGLKQPPTGRSYYYDSGQAALAICVTANGNRTFYCTRRVQGNSERIRIGKFPEVTVEQARRRATELLGDIAKGKNPQAERRAARVEHTLGALFNWWLENHAKPRLRPATQAEAVRLFEKHLQPWKNYRLSAINKQSVQALHTRLGNENGKFLANRVLALLRT